jgi:hypothetical protein
MNGGYMKNKSGKKEQEEYKLSDFNLDKPEIIDESMQVEPRYTGKLRMLKTSVSLPGYVIDDLRQMARIKGMTSYQAILREFLSEKIYEEKKRLDLF